MPVCKNCGRSYDSEQSFCAGCGRPIVQIPSAAPSACPACGAAASGGSQFCARCGHALAVQTPVNPTPQEEAPSESIAQHEAVTELANEEAAGAAAFIKKLTAPQIAVLGAVLGLLLGGIYLAYTSWRIAEQRKTVAALERALQENIFVPSRPAVKTAAQAHASSRPAEPAPAATVVAPPPSAAKSSARRPGKAVAKKFNSSSWQVASSEPQAKAETARSAPAQPSPSAAPEKTPVRVLRETPPKFPMAARLTLSTGDVHVQVSVSAAGEVQEATAISGPRLLRKAACDNVRQWRFQPATVNGKPVAGETEVVVSFTFEQD